MLPRKIYRLWLGDAPIPEALDLHWATLASVFTGWELVTLRELPDNPVTGDLLQSCKSLIGRVDIARLEWLYRLGGMHVHFDVSAIKEPTWVDSFEAWTCKGERGPGNYCIGAVPGSSAVLEVLKVIASRRRHIVNAHDHRMHAETGPERLSLVFNSVKNATIIGSDAATECFKHHSLGTWRQEPVESVKQKPRVSVSQDGLAVVVKDPAGALPCIHRRNHIGDTACGSCTGKPRYVEVFACEKKVSCTITKHAKDRRIQNCQKCDSRCTGGTLLDFCDFSNRFAGRTGYIIGRGATTFRNEDLATLDGPIFFINDAAQLERYCPDNADTFFHAQDKRVAAVVPGLRSTAVLAKGSEIGYEVARGAMPDLGKLIWTVFASHGEERLLTITRDQLAIERRLYRARRDAGGPCPTICQAIHFAWYVGCQRVKLIRCDGHATGYAPDLENRSASPEVNVGKYVRARHDAEHVMKSLGMEWEYLGTPTGVNDHALR